MSSRPDEADRESAGVTTATPYGGPADGMVEQSAEGTVGGLVREPGDGAVGESGDGTAGGAVEESGDGAVGGAAEDPAGGADRVRRIGAPTASLEAVREGEAPEHVAIIMDGNGRWARRRGLPRSAGHRAGMKAVREAIAGAVEAGVSHLSLYAFSDENWSRPPSEVASLMSLLEEYVDSQRGGLVRANARVTVFGDRTRLPDSVRKSIAELEVATSRGSGLQVHLAISYGSRAEIVGAARSLAERCASGDLSPDAIDEETFARELLTGAWPDPDLLIRTSGEQRVSNFLLWQLAYAEILVTDVLWPDFRRKHLFGAVVEYRARERRFGLVKA